MARSQDASLADSFADLSAECLKAAGQLEAVIAARPPLPGDSSFSKVSHSQPPWNSAVAFAFFDLRELARDIEARFRIHAELPARPRGFSDANTGRALEAAAKLLSAAGDSAASAAIRDLDRWLRGAKIALGKLELPQRLPRLPGKPEPVCPFCRHKTLRMFPLHGYIICITPQSVCHDDKGRKPRAVMEYSSFTRQFELVWQDNVVGLPATAEETAA